MMLVTQKLTLNYAAIEKYFCAYPKNIDKEKKQSYTNKIQDGCKQ